MLHCLSHYASVKEKIYKEAVGHILNFYSSLARDSHSPSLEIAKGNFDGVSNLQERARMSKYKQNRRIPTKSGNVPTSWATNLTNSNHRPMSNV